eukprot:403370601
MGNSCEKNGDTQQEYFSEISLAKRCVSSPNNQNHHILESTVQNDYLKDKLQKLKIFESDAQTPSSSVQFQKKFQANSQNNSRTNKVDTLLFNPINQQNAGPSKQVQSHSIKNEISVSQPSTACSSLLSTKRQVNLNLLNKPNQNKNDNIAGVESGASTSKSVNKSGAKPNLTLGALYQQQANSRMNPSDKYIIPAPGSFGQYYQRENLITVYCPVNFEVFQVRVHSVMTLSEFKNRIAQRYETYADNIIICVGDKEYRGEISSKIDESKINLCNDLGINEKTIVKLTFKAAVTIKSRETSQNNRGKSKSGYSSSVVVTTSINNYGDNINNELRSRGQTLYNQEETEVQNTNVGLLNLYNRYQEQMNAKNVVLEEYKLHDSFGQDENLLDTTKIHINDSASKEVQSKLDISNRHCIEQRSNRYSQNIKLIQKLKEKVNQDLAKCVKQTKQLTTDFSPSPLASFNKTYETEKIGSSKNIVGSFLNRLQHDARKQELEQQVTTVILSNKTFDNSVIPREKSRLQIKTCNMNLASTNQSFQKKSFIQDIGVNSQKTSVRNITLDSQQKTKHDYQPVTISINDNNQHHYYKGGSASILRPSHISSVHSEKALQTQQNVKVQNQDLLKHEEKSKFHNKQPAQIIVQQLPTTKILRSNIQTNAELKESVKNKIFGKNNLEYEQRHSRMNQYTNQTPKNQ